MKVEENGSLSARDPLPPRPLFAVESGLKKKNENAWCGLLRGKGDPGFEKRNVYFSTLDTRNRWFDGGEGLGMDVIGVKIERGDCSRIDGRGCWEKFFRFFFKGWNFFLRELWIVILVVFRNLKDGKECYDKRWCSSFLGKKVKRTILNNGLNKYVKSISFYNNNPKFFIFELFSFFNSVRSKYKNNFLF